MKILVSSHACSPYHGSELAYGWRACRALAEDHELWILTSPTFRREIQRASEEGLVPDSMHFVYVGEPVQWHPSRLLARFQGWWDYVRFQKLIVPVAQDLHRQIHFDCAHLVTYTTWRVGCPLWRLGIPLVWGPISGTEVFPTRFFGILSWSARVFELTRLAQSAISLLSPEVRRTAKNAACILATHRQAYNWISRLRGRTEGLEIFCNVFFADQYIAELRREWPDKPPQGPLRIFGSGNLEGRKGVALALRALAAARERGLKFTYQISSRGPEYDYLDRLRQRLRLEAEVTLGETMPRPEFLATLRASHVYLLPSLREGAGQTMMEAMLAGCVPVVAYWGGPAEIVTDQSGFRVPVTNVEQMVDDLCRVLLEIDSNRQLLLTKGRAAERQIAENHNERVYRQRLNSAYEYSVRGVRQEPAT